MSNIIGYISGSNILLDEQVLATQVGEPMFHWYGELINVALTFSPVIILVAMFWVVYDLGRRAISRSSLDSKKDLENK